MFHIDSMRDTGANLVYTHPCDASQGGEGVKSKCHKGVIMGGGGEKWLILVSHDLWTFPYLNFRYR